MKKPSNSRLNNKKKDNGRFVDEIRPYARKISRIFLASLTSEMLMYPLDLVKTRMHLYGQQFEIRGAKKLPKMGVLGTAAYVYRTEGLKKLYAGFVPMMLRNTVYSGLRLTLYEYLISNLYTRTYPKESAPTLIVSGGIAGCVTCLFAQPVDFVKVKMQVAGLRNEGDRTFRQHLVHYYYASGPDRLFRNREVNIIRTGLITIGNISVFNLTQSYLRDVFQMNDGFKMNLIASSVSGFVATMLSNPADVIKTRLMTQPLSPTCYIPLRYKGDLDCMKKLLRYEGFFGLYSGFVPCAMRQVLWSILFWEALADLKAYV